MAGGMMNRLSSVLQKFDRIIQTIFRNGAPPGALCTIDCNSFVNNPRTTNYLGTKTLKEIIGDGILWGVPKFRRSLERRIKRKFGYLKFQWLPTKANAKILMCSNCGHNYEAGRLCEHCYEKVKIETKEMQKAIQNELGLSPIEKDVIVLYDGERDGQIDDFWKNQQIVEIPKKRPAWFHQNLLQPTTQEPSDKKDVKPTHLA